MKICSFALLGVTLLLSGCEAFSTRVDERFSTVPPHTRTYAANRRAVFEAGQVAVKNVGLLLGRTSSSKGSIEAYTPIRPGDGASDTAQTTMDIRIEDTGGGESEVSVLVSQHTEGNFPGGVSEQAQREHSLYDLYFNTLQQVLEENGSLKTAQKP